MIEHRAIPRLRTYKGGRVNALGLPGMDCVIRNLTDAGACIEIASDFIPADHFNLVIKPEYLTRKCRVIWRKPTKIGIEFL